MNIYATITFFFLAIAFMYFRLDFLAFSFVVLGVISIFFKFEKNQAKDAWEQMKNAEGSNPEKEFRGYINNATKLGVEIITPDEGTKAQLTTPEKLHPASKNFFEELKNLFK